MTSRLSIPNPFSDICSFDRFCHYNGLTKTQALQEIADGYLAANLVDGHYIVSSDAERSWVKSGRLPPRIENVEPEDYSYGCGPDSADLYASDATKMEP